MVRHGSPRRVSGCCRRRWWRWRSRPSREIVLSARTSRSYLTQKPWAGPKPADVGWYAAVGSAADTAKPRLNRVRKPAAHGWRRRGWPRVPCPVRSPVDPRKCPKPFHAAFGNRLQLHPIRTISDDDSASCIRSIPSSDESSSSWATGTSRSQTRGAA